MVGRLMVLCLCALCGSTAARGAFIIDSRSFFNNIDHTLIDFETRGDGSPVITGPAGGLVIPPDEYAVQGFVFDDRSVIWQEVRGPTCDLSCGEGDALLEVGSPRIALAIGTTGSSITFLDDIRAFSFGVVQSGWPRNPATLDFAPTIIAFDSLGTELVRVALWGDLIDGGFGEWDGVVPFIAYGEIGLASETPIARLEFINTGLNFFDDFRFSSVPAPTTATPLLLSVIALARRRR